MGDEVKDIWCSGDYYQLCPSQRNKFLLALGGARDSYIENVFVYKTVEQISYEATEFSDGTPVERWEYWVELTEEPQKVVGKKFIQRLMRVLDLPKDTDWVIRVSDTDSSLSIVFVVSNYFGPKDEYFKQTL